jgi:hypothetical protein
MTTLILLMLAAADPSRPAMPPESAAQRAPTTAPEPPQATSSGVPEILAEVGRFAISRDRAVDKARPLLDNLREKELKTLDETRDRMIEDVMVVQALYDAGPGGRREIQQKAAATKDRATLRRELVEKGRPRTKFSKPALDKNVASILPSYPVLPETVAEVAGKKISGRQLLASMTNRLEQIRREKYDVLNSALQEMVDDTVIDIAAQQAKVPVEKFLKKNVDGKTKKPSGKDVSEFLQTPEGQAQLQKFPKKSDAEKAVDQIILEERKAETRKALLEDLRKKSDVRLYLKPPETQDATAAPQPASSTSSSVPAGQR